MQGPRGQGRQAQMGQPGRAGMQGQMGQPGRQGMQGGHTYTSK